MFLFAGPFRFPETECGFLFKVSLEVDRSADCVATPFDSGGLLEHHRPPDDEDPKAFLDRHEMSVPEYRGFLELVLNRLFAEPWDYLTGTDPVREGPVRFLGGDADQRRWTFEVRVEREVPVRPHLQALFFSTAATRHAPVQEMISWSRENNVDIVQYDSPRGTIGESFKVMDAQCVHYMRAHLA